MTADLTIEKRKSNTPAGAVFSILIPTWNNLPYLKLCIAAIEKNSHFSHQIIVHINEGKDGTLEWLQSHTNIDYTFSKENIGICYALNISRSLAETDYILYMNDDMYVCPGWDFELFNEIKKIGHPHFFLSATMIEPFFTNNPCVAVKDYGTSIETFRENDLLNGFHSLPMQDWQGATWPPNVVHRDTWDLAGGYSIEFSPGMNSDPDFSMKLWQMGIRLFKGVSKSRVYHFGCKTTGRISQHDGSFIFFTKWKITSSTLTNYYLLRGKPFTGPLPEPVLPPMLKLKNFMKRLNFLFRG